MFPVPSCPFANVSPAYPQHAATDHDGRQCASHLAATDHGGRQCASHHAATDHVCLHILQLLTTGVASHKVIW